MKNKYKLLYDAYSTLYLLTNHRMARQVNRNIRKTPQRIPTVIPIKPSLQMFPVGAWVMGSVGVVVPKLGVGLKSQMLLEVVVVTFFWMFPPGNFVVFAIVGVAELGAGVGGLTLAGLSVGCETKIIVKTSVIL